MMNQRFNRGVTFLLTGLLAVTSGCSFLHELSPNRLWRLNRTSGPRNVSPSAPYYSIPDPPVPAPHDAQASASDLKYSPLVVGEQAV